MSALTTERAFSLPHGRGTLAARCWGADLPGVPVLALHGWLDNAATFDALLPLLSLTRPVVALDLPGHGFSSHRPPGVRYHQVDYLDDVLAVMAQLSPEAPMPLLGHSLGAGLAMMIAGALPDRVESLVLIDGIGPMTFPADRFPELMAKALTQWTEHDPTPRPILSHELALQARCQGMTGPLTRTAAARLLSRGLVQRDGAWFWSTDKRLRLDSLARYHEDQVLETLARITAPALLILAEQGVQQLVGDNDHYIARLKQLATLRTVVLPGGHHLHLEDDTAAAVAAAVQSFWA